MPPPRYANSAAGLGNASSLKINEWLASSANGDDWFELFNSGAQPVSVGGLFLTDDLTQKTKSPIPALSFIGSGADGFIQFIADGNVTAGADHTSFSISAAGSSLGLLAPSGTAIDSVAFGQQQTGISQGRFPDGSANIVSFDSTLSPAESNYLPLPNVVVNEVLSHTDPPLEDAVEFFNPTPAALNIGGGSSVIPSWTSKSIALLTTPSFPPKALSSFTITSSIRPMAPRFHSPLTPLTGPRLFVSGR